MIRPTAPTIGDRALNRALLARQHLIGRTDVPVIDAIEHLVALQAQVPVDPYVGLWSRLAGFDPMVLSGALEARTVARAPLLRVTLHLATAPDLASIRVLVDPVMERNYRTGSPFGRRLAGVDMAPVLAVGRESLDARPRTRAELRSILGERWPDHDVDAMSVAVCILEPVVQVTPRGLWRRAGQPTWARMETWLGRPMDPDPELDRLLLRYLAAFGPASVMDAQAWSGLTRLGPDFERLRPRLQVFRSEAGRELFDLPDAPRPDPAVPVPVRFLPQYDNVLLGHADRSRIVPPAVRTAPWPTVWVGTFLVDGMLAGTWRVEDAATGATIVLGPFEPLSRASTQEVEAEALALTAFLRPGARTAQVRYAEPGAH